MLFLYCFVCPVKIFFQARVNVTPTIWKTLVEFAKHIAADNQWDAYYIFRRLCVQSAFRFVANLEELYPGVPLYTRSTISLPVRRTFLTKVQRKLLTAANRESNEQHNDADIIPPEVFDLPEYLKNNWNLIFEALNDYIAIKDRIGQIPGPSTADDPFAGSSDDNTLWSPGLNLVNHKVNSSLTTTYFVLFKDSVVPIAELMKKFSGGVHANMGSTTDSEDERREAEEDIGARRRRLRNRKDWCAAIQKPDN